MSKLGQNLGQKSLGCLIHDNQWKDSYVFQQTSTQTLRVRISGQNVFNFKVRVCKVLEKYIDRNLQSTIRLSDKISIRKSQCISSCLEIKEMKTEEYKSYFWNSNRSSITLWDIINFQIIILYLQRISSLFHLNFRDFVCQF